MRRHKRFLWEHSCQKKCNSLPNSFAFLIKFHLVFCCNVVWSQTQRRRLIIIQRLFLIPRGVLVDDSCCYVDKIKGRQHCSKKSQKVGLISFYCLSAKEFARNENSPSPLFDNARLFFVVVVPRGCVSPNEFQNVKICISIW